MKKFFSLVFGLCILFSASALYALDAVEILGGYLAADIKGRHRYYRGIPLFVSFDFDAPDSFSRFEIKDKARLSFIIEPFFNAIIKPNNNIEVGSNFLFKYTFSLSEKVKPYFKGGLGILYMTYESLEQATQYNFLPQGGGGIHYFLKENMALNLEYRCRHLSNASIKTPNNGIDSHSLLGGVTFFFK